MTMTPGHLGKLVAMGPGRARGSAVLREGVGIRNSSGHGEAWLQRDGHV